MKAKIYWDVSDPQCEGWAWSIDGGPSGPCDSIADGIEAIMDYDIDTGDIEVVQD